MSLSVDAGDQPSTVRPYPSRPGSTLGRVLLIRIIRRTPRSFKNLRAPTPYSRSGCGGSPSNGSLPAERAGDLLAHAHADKNDHAGFFGGGEFFHGAADEAFALAGFTEEVGQEVHAVDAHERLAVALDATFDERDVFGRHPACCGRR